MTMPKRFNYIPLSEINAHIIRPLRKIDTSADSYRILENGIIKDGQRHLRYDAANRSRRSSYCNGNFWR